MTRTFIVLLLLAVFFLAGTLYGMDQSGMSESPPAVPEENSYLFGELNEQDFPVNETNMNTPKGESLEIAEQQNFTQQTASFLEAGVKGIYDVIVHILYQFAQLFF